MRRTLLTSFFLMCVYSAHSQSPTDSAKFLGWNVTSMKYADDSTLQWTTENELDKDTVLIEEFRWNKWVVIAKTKSKGGVNNSYSFKIQDRTRCPPKYRIYHPKYKRYSSSIKINWREYRHVTFRPAKVRDSIWFSEPTNYIIYDAHGKIVQEGDGPSIGVKDLERGTYYINFDCEMSKFLKR